MKRLIPILLLALTLSSCTVRFDSRVDVNADESGTFALEIALDAEFRAVAESGEGPGFDLSEGVGDVPAGWNVTEFTDGEFEGFRVAADFADFADLDVRLAELATTASDDSPAPIFIETSGLSRNGDQFVFSTQLTGLEEGLTDLGNDSDDFTLEGFDPETLLSQLFQIRFVITLPGEIGSNNADSVDGNTLTWNINFTDEGRSLEAVSTVGGSGGLSTSLMVGLLILALGVVGFVVYRATQRSRRREPVWMEGLTSSSYSAPEGNLAADPFARPADTAPESSAPTNAID